MPSHLYSVSSGPATAPVTLLLVHPLGSSHEFWDELVPLWAERLRCVAVDLRGAGRSPIPDRPWKMDEHVRDLIQLREELGLRHVVAVGCAMGSLICSAYANADAEVVCGLVMSNTTHVLGEESRQRHESRLKLVNEGGVGALLPMIVDMAFHNLTKNERYTRYIERFKKNDPGGYGSLALGMVGTDIAETLKSLRVPTLITVGVHDILLPPPLSRRVHEMVRGSEFRVLQDAAHFAPYQVPEAFAQLVCDFLERRGIFAPS
jgi:3-oxoadipate enol-lactonase